MENVTFCFPNWTLPSSAITPTITGSGWLDLSKLQGEVLSEMARYPGVNPADTKVVIDLGATRDVDVIAIPYHNAFLEDTARVRLATDAGFTDVVLDSGFIEFFGEVYPYGSLAWGHLNWMDGRLTAEQAGNLDAPPPWMYAPDSTVYGRYLELSFDFSNNPDGWVDLGQVVCAPFVRPIRNISYGASPPFYRDPSPKFRSKGGAQFKDKQRKYRVSRMDFNNLNESEIYGQFFEMVRQYGVTEPFFFIYNSDAETSVLQKQCFMATAERIGDPVNRARGVFSMQVEISEEF